MRISQDDDSWAAGGVLRRDFRHTHGDPEVPRHKSMKKKASKRQLAAKAKRAKEVAAHEADGIQGHLFVWDHEIVSHAKWCNATGAYWLHKSNYWTGETCGYDKISWRASRDVRDGFVNNKPIRVSRYICASCGKVDKVRYTLASDKNDWGY